jgi:hypothetical protein
MRTVKQTEREHLQFKNSAVPQPHNHTQARKRIHAKQNTKEKCMSRQIAYFSGDGNYGMENGNFVLVDVSKWTEEDWDRIEETEDFKRPSVAMSISDVYEG